MTPSTTEDPYAQAPLDLGGQSFRLVELQPCAPADLIKCCLTTHPLPQNPPSFPDMWYLWSTVENERKETISTHTLQPECPAYIALSYMWDHESPKDTIGLNGTAFQVGHSLWTFLNQMRLNEMFGTYWIDALCINQSDVRERNHQVQLMRTIYSQARSVSIWLGEAKDGSIRQEAMLLIERFKYDTNWERIIDETWTDGQAQGMCEFHEDQYWDRMWIVQEIALAESATIHCGVYNLDLFVFQDMLNDIRYWDKLTVLCKRRSAAQGLDELLMSVREERSLYGVLKWCGKRKAIRAHDKIYALLGLVEEEAARSIPVDYTITVLKLWKNVFSYLCQSADRGENLERLKKHAEDLASAIHQNLRSEISEEEINHIIDRNFLVRQPMPWTRAALELPDAPSHAVYFEVKPTTTNPKGLRSVRDGESKEKTDM